jgi:hypothetical protein
VGWLWTRPASLSGVPLFVPFWWSATTSVPISWSIQLLFSIQSHFWHQMSLVRRRLYKTGIGLTTGFIRSQSITQLGYSVLHFITHNN